MVYAIVSEDKQIRLSRNKLHFIEFLAFEQKKLDSTVKRRFIILYFEAV